MGVMGINGGYFPAICQVYLDNCELLLFAPRRIIFQVSAVLFLGGTTYNCDCAGTFYEGKNCSDIVQVCTPEVQCLDGKKCNNDPTVSAICFSN